MGCGRRCPQVRRDRGVGTAPQHREHARWACDDEDAAAAEIAAALNIGHGRACGEMDLAVVLRDRFPKVAAAFLAGELNARRVWLIANRTYLVTTPAAVAALDQVIAERITAWGPLTEDKLTQAIDVWVDAIDPGAVRRTRNSARTRDFTVAETNPQGTAAVFGRLLGPDAALLKQRVAAMARGVCEDDPRTLAQRRADAMGALGAGSTVLSCACANPDCPAAVDDGRASSIVIHVIAEQASTEAPPDPQYCTAKESPPTTPRTQAPRLRRGSPDAAAEPATRRRPLCSSAVGSCPAPCWPNSSPAAPHSSWWAAPTRRTEPHYRPATALDEFVRIRDLTCRAPGCDRSGMFADIDHTVAYPAGADPSRKPQVLLPNSSLDQDVLARLHRPPARRRHRRRHHPHRAHLHHQTRQQPVLPRLGHHHTRTTRLSRPTTRVRTAP